MNRWTEYMSQLFDDRDRNETPNEYIDDTGPDIIREEIEYPMKLVDHDSIKIFLDLLNTKWIALI